MNGSFMRKRVLSVELFFRIPHASMNFLASDKAEILAGSFKPGFAIQASTLHIASPFLHINLGTAKLFATNFA